MKKKSSILPQEVKDYFTCLFFHTKTPYWDGTYIQNEEGIVVERISWMCKECNAKHS